MEARKQLGELMNRAYYGGETFIIKRDDLAMVKIEPIYSELERAKAKTQFFSFVERVRQTLASSEQQEVDIAFTEALKAFKPTS